jgi:Na+-driven multidrug efflux pump
MTAAGVLLIAFATRSRACSSDDAAVIADTRSFIYMLGLCQPLMAVDYAIGGALRGAADTRFPLLTLFIGLYAFRAAARVGRDARLGLTTPWLWAALIADYASRAVLKVWRYRSGRVAARFLS